MTPTPTRTRGPTRIDPRDDVFEKARRCGKCGAPRPRNDGTVPQGDGWVCIYAACRACGHRWRIFRDDSVATEND